MNNQLSDIRQGNWLLNSNLLYWTTQGRHCLQVNIAIRYMAKISEHPSKSLN